MAGRHTRFTGSPLAGLPDLDLVDLMAIPKWGKPILVFEILAEGYRKVVSLPVDFIVDDESQWPPEETQPEWL